MNDGVVAVIDDECKKVCAHYKFVHRKQMSYHVAITNNCIVLIIDDR